MTSNPANKPSFKYNHLPNIDSYQSPAQGIGKAGDLPLNNDIQILAVLEYKGIPDIFILKGEYLEYEDTIWSILGCVCWCVCCCGFCPEKKLSRAKTGYLVRIPVSLILSSTPSPRDRDAEYKLSYKTWAIINKPNFMCKRSGFLFIGFEVSLEDYIQDVIIIEKAKKNIEGILELF
jgi:hypothetical protein